MEEGVGYGCFDPMVCLKKELVERGVVFTV